MRPPTHPTSASPPGGKRRRSRDAEPAHDTPGPPLDGERPVENERATISTLVSLGLTTKALQRVLDDPPPPPVLDAELRGLRSGGYELEADMLQLVTTNEVAASLVVGRAPSGGPVVRTRVWWLGAGLILLYNVNLVAGAVASAISVLGAAWRLRVRLRQLDQRERQILAAWFQAKLVRVGLLPVGRFALVAAIILGLIAVPVGLAVPGIGIAIGLLALLLFLVTLLSSRAGRPEPTTPPSRTPVPVSHPPTSAWPQTGAPRSSTSVAPLVVGRRPARRGLKGLPPVSGSVLLLGLLVPPLTVTAIALARSDIRVSTATVVWVLVVIVGGIVVRWRTKTWCLVLDDEGVTHRGFVRTRRFRWSEVTKLLVREDGPERARVEVVSTTGEHTSVWSGSVDDPVLPEIAAFGQDRAAGAAGSRRRGAGCLIALSLGLSLFLAFAAFTTLVHHNQVTVDPAQVPQGVDVWIGTAPSDGRPTDPWVECRAPLNPPRSWEPASCPASRRTQLRWTFGLAGGFAVMAAISVAAIRANRRANAPDAPGPLIGGPPP